ncbi:MAG: helix-turn-helix transcriptional regulator [Elusimicrobia bacterium]|nr:helix-turn-helix transcriptional regulator [Elusimicrobiota bacterium]
MPQSTVDIYAFVARRLREERKARGMTLEDVSSRAIMNTSFLHYIEANKKRPSLGMIKKIVDALGLPIEELFAGAPKNKPQDIPTLRRITELVREAPPRRRAAILKVVKTLSRTD